MKAPKHITFNGVRFCRDAKTGYYRYNQTGSKKTTILLHRFVWEYYHGKIPKGFEVHHKDFNKANNDITNLTLLAAKDHLKLHAKNPSRKLSAYLHSRKSDETLKKAAAWHRSEEGKSWHKKHYESIAEKFNIVREYECRMCKKKFSSTKVASKFCSNSCKSRWRREQGLDDVEITCFVCGRKKMRNRFKVVKGEPTFCSRSCSNIWRAKNRHTKSPCKHREVE